jgi:hypothetical protein
VPSPLRLVLLLLAACSFSGCAFLYSIETDKRYHRVRVTNIQGKLVAEWIAEGYVARTEVGYRFRAVQRTTGTPYPQQMRYPYGRMMEVGGQNIVVTRCGPPRWLYELRYGRTTVVVREETTVTRVKGESTK